MGPRVEISVAPVDYPGVDRVCYDVVVLNGDPDGEVTPDVVWSKQGLCSNQFGNGARGDLSYVGPCDADVGGNNFVQLTLADVFVGATAVLLDQVDVGTGGSHEGEDDDYRNPCPTGEPCTLDFECLENRDVSVVFNLTIMRDANQGWFDIAVNFDDIFCSAKFDTCYPGEDLEDPDDDEAINLLHAADNRRHHTAVLGFACTGGPLAAADAASETHLYMNDIVITCPGQVFRLSPSATQDGNVYTTTSVPPIGTVDMHRVWQYAIYAGQEQLDCGAGPGTCDKVYWNIAIGIEGLPAGCTISTTATASSGILESDIAESTLAPEVTVEGDADAQDSSVPGMTPARTTHPVVVLDEAPITDGDGVICGQYPLDASDDVLRSDYTLVDAPANFGHELSQVNDGTVNLGRIDHDHAPGQVAPRLLQATMSIADSIGGYVAGSSRYFDLYDWYRFELGSGLSLADFAITCDSAAPSAGQPAIAVQFFGADGRSLTGGFRGCRGDGLAIERGADDEGATIYALVVYVHPTEPQRRFHWRFAAACLDVLGAGAGCLSEAWYLTVPNPYSLELDKK